MGLDRSASCGGATESALRTYADRTARGDSVVDLSTKAGGYASTWIPYHNTTDSNLPLSGSVDRPLALVTGLPATLISRIYPSSFPPVVIRSMLLPTTNEDRCGLCIMPRFLPGRRRGAKGLDSFLGSRMPATIRSSRDETNFISVCGKDRRLQSASFVRSES